MLFSPVYPQIDWEFSGYVVDFPIYQNAHKILVGEGTNLFVNLSRLRLRPVVYVGNNTRLNLEYEIDALYQSSALQFTPAEGAATRQYFRWRWSPVNETRWKLVHFIDRLYLRQDFAFGNVIIGRQRVAWGTGRIWNPTDLFNPLNPANFQKIEKDGADLVTVQFYLDNFTDVTLVWNPRRSPRAHNAGFRFRDHIGEYDWSLMGGVFDERIVVGGDFAGNLGDAGVRGEGMVSINRKAAGERFVRFVVGADYQFTSRVYALIEYQHNGEGRRDPRKYDVFGLLEGRLINLAQNYLFLQSLVQFSPLLNGALAWNQNIDDGSGFVLLTASYSLTENAFLNAGLQLFYGRELDEYWYYPNSLFLQGEFYF
ncbi:MAG: hypothetical protein D6681_09690 [Calditrichaeota bacterium]|nr:MAG: hypothetical protein D6681_09690 [Calditrichota bacterium]